MVSVPRFRFDFLRQDLVAGCVVFLVALPLCLGIALASETPPLSGIITGVVAGLLVTLLSGSELSVSGPAAGLVITTIAARQDLGSLEGLFVATSLSGIFQIILGWMRAGYILVLFPSSVIRGMLAGIGIIIALKQIPLAVGWHAESNPDDGILCLFSPFCLDNLYTSLSEPSRSMSTGAVWISMVSLAILIGWERVRNHYGGYSKPLPPALLAVIIGITLNQMLTAFAPSYALTAEAGQLVTIPRIRGLHDLLSNSPTHLGAWLIIPRVWLYGLLIALIGSIETLLCLTATDKLDPLQRVSRPNQELFAQGVGNIVTGFLGGIPMTSVIARSSANIYAGGRTRISAFVHGLLLLTTVLMIPRLLNMIPLSTLAAILILVGYKLANIQLVKQLWSAGFDQFLPFTFTIFGVVFLDLLSGVLIGTCLSVVVTLAVNHNPAFTVVRNKNSVWIRFIKDMGFLQKIAFKRTLIELPDNSHVSIDGQGIQGIAEKISGVLKEFQSSIYSRNISLEITNVPATTATLGSVTSRTQQSCK